MDTGKGVQLNQYPLHHSLYFGVATSDPVDNPGLFCECDHMKKKKEGSDMMEVNRSGEDNVMQDEDWVRLGASTTGVDFDAYMSVDQQLATCGVVGSGSCVEERPGDGGGDDDEAKFYGTTCCV
jgi:hypothetical protein